MKKRKYKIKWGRVLFLFLLFGVIIFISLQTVYHANQDSLSQIGYSKEEVVELKHKLSSMEIEELSKQPYLPYLTDLLKEKEYHSENLFSYINYISQLDTDYSLKDIVYLVNRGITNPYSQKLVDVIHQDYFILSRLDRYMNYHSDDAKEIVTNVNSDLDYEFYTNIQKTDTSKDTLLIVNKYYQLEQNYHYGDLVVMDSQYDNKSGSKLSSVAYEAFKKLVDDAEKEGYHIRNNSAYRSYATQNSLYQNYKNANGLAWADKWSARPGHSEHQTGLALDVGEKGHTNLNDFVNSKEFIWMKDHAHLYGFILRYPEGKEYLTGYGYEPWHYRYVGIEVATYIYEHQITFEEYYAYFIKESSY